MVIADSSELRGLVRGTPAQPFLEEHNSRMFDSIRSVASSAVGALDYVAQQKSPGFSVRDWVDDERPGVLFMPYKAGQIAASSSGSDLRLTRLCDILEKWTQGEREAEKSKLWFVVDESWMR